ncbi:hypothetical protein HY008_03550 [Candidatus Woesebacteria bacterium]|nr:hypothetical protein [Candidatus Woesebacteria bacterium]
MQLTYEDKRKRTIEGKEIIAFASFSSYHLIAVTARAKLENIVFNFGKELPIPGGIPTVDNPKWTGSFYDDTEVMLLSRAIYGEAGGEPKEAKVAVGWAIRNRVEDSRNRWGIT